MAKTKDSRSQNSDEELIKIRYSLNESTVYINKMAFSPNGYFLATPLSNGICTLWTSKDGDKIIDIQCDGRILCVDFAPLAPMVAMGGDGNARNIIIYNYSAKGIIFTLRGHTDNILNLCWSPNGELLASSSANGEVCIWDIGSGKLLNIYRGYKYAVNSIAWSPNSNRFCTGSIDSSVHIWEIANNVGQELKGQKEAIECITWSNDGLRIAAGSQDRLIYVWETETGQLSNIIEGHLDEISSLAFISDDQLMGSVDKSGLLIIHEVDSWAKLLKRKISTSNHIPHIAFNQTFSFVAAYGENRKRINVWELNVSKLLKQKKTEKTIHYINAKVVLVGDSTVGKSGLGIRIAENTFRSTDSTHGAQFWQIVSPIKINSSSVSINIKTEITLWDFAGQPDYRLVHQLFIDDTDVALLIFDCSDAMDPFHGIPYWAKVLKRHAPTHAIKLLVSARQDVSPVTASKKQINDTLIKFDLKKHFVTSAKLNYGIKQLFDFILKSIPWDKLPMITTDRLFNIIREYLMELKESNESLIELLILKTEVKKRFPEGDVTDQAVLTVVRLLQGRGFIQRLDPRPEMTIVLLKPELLNQYASSIIHAARNHPSGLGIIAERDLLLGNFPVVGFERLPAFQERLILESISETLISHDLCFREVGFLVFPTQISVTQPEPDEQHLRIEVAYVFSGSIESIYASLVVRLNHSGHFRRESQWNYAAEFSRNGKKLGFSLEQISEGTGKLGIYFHPEISDSDRVLFIMFITDHLKMKGIDIEEHIPVFCRKCDKEIRNQEAIDARMQAGFLDIPCQYCGFMVIIPQSIEQLYERNTSLLQKQKEIIQVEQEWKAQEIKDFKSDQLHYSKEKDSVIHILHISDIHIQSQTQINSLRLQLETDLIKNLDIKRIEYLVITGDIATYSTVDEYFMAFTFLDAIVKKFGLDASRVIIVPGNHDLNYDLSEDSYKHIPKRKMPSSIDNNKMIQAGETGVFARDEALYFNRFFNFNNEFYKKIYRGQEYPSTPNDGIIIENEEDKILFLALNSSWEIDHHFENRASINPESLALALDKTQDEKYENYLKIAVWHHPVTGKEMMNDAFLELLNVQGFKICMHGHIHESIEGFHKYDDNRGLYIIGAGTFGATTRQQTPGIPLQYNLIDYDSSLMTITVRTRKKEKLEGAWSADARWQDKEDPKPFYFIKLDRKC